tara:strand:+ start:15950 stop:16177 length:228 start_codon:yes stop_codon:yes gene_type:complete
MKKIDLQMYLLKDLQLNIEKIREECDSISETIDKKGVTGNYSINTSVFELATRISRDCAMLGYLKNFDLKTGDKK